MKMKRRCERTMCYYEFGLVLRKISIFVRSFPMRIMTSKLELENHDVQIRTRSFPMRTMRIMTKEPPPDGVS